MGHSNGNYWIVSVVALILVVEVAILNFTYVSIKKLQVQANKFWKAVCFRQLPVLYVLWYIII